ncbi:MAG TPA: GAF domain-containing protein, partial [Terriglobia bacterium]|nr:GAF domain-containing protein [Terriglobia bacterium]
SIFNWLSNFRQPTNVERLVSALNGDVSGANCSRRFTAMTADRAKLLADLKLIVSNAQDRTTSLKRVAALLQNTGGYRWVGLYDVDRAAGVVRNIVWNGPAAPEYPTFPITKGLSGAAVASRETVNVGDVLADPRYLTAFGSTRSEIIVPVFDAARENVVGTIDVESETRHAFTREVQVLLEACSDVIRPLWHR